MGIKDRLARIYYEKVLYRLGEINLMNNAVAEFHSKTFLPLKNSLNGKSVVICGAGPSLKEYKPIKDAVHIALNRAFLFDKVKFEYIICQDFDGIRHCQKELIDYKGNNCVKFLGCGSHVQEKVVPQKIIPNSLITHSNALPFIQDNYLYLDGMKSKFASHLECEPVGAGPNVAFAAVNIVAYLGAKIIYLAGCDMSGGHFSNKNQSEVEKNKELKELTNQWAREHNQLLKKWDEWNTYLKIYYPDTKIVSINPVGLKGKFEEIYQ